MKIWELDQPRVGDIVEFETDPDTVVEGRIIAETADGYIYEFSETGYTELNETCTHGKYYCSTDKKWKCRQGPKQSRTTEAANAAQQAAIAIAKKKKAGVAEGSEHFNQCYVQACKVYDRAEDKKLNPVLLQVAGYKGDGSNADKKWLALPQRVWQHYVVVVNDTVYDPTAKQFGNDKPTKYSVEKLQQDWDQQYQIRPKQDVDEAHPNSKIYDKCWDGYKKVPGKKRGEKGSCVEESSGYIPRNSKEAKDPRWSSALTGDVTTHTMRDQISSFFPTTAPDDGQEQVTEAEYQGRTVPLGKPMKGDVKKSKVYVRNAKGNVVKVNFGDPNMRIKKTSPKHRKSFRARHHCENPGPRWKARYWSCRAW